jgi:hypothetical protein
MNFNIRRKRCFESLYNIDRLVFDHNSASYSTFYVSSGVVIHKESSLWAGSNN